MGIRNWESFIGEPKKIAPENHPLEPNDFNRSMADGYKHARARSIKSKIDNKVWNSYFKFSFVRNPWDRTVSMYFKKRKEFPVIVRSILPRGKLLFGASLYTKYNILGKTSEQQVEFLADKNGNIDIDFIGRYENIKEDFKKVCRKVGIKSDMEGRHDSTDRRNYRYYYNEKTKKIVYDKNREDIEVFNYDF